MDKEFDFREKKMGNPRTVFLIFFLSKIRKQNKRQLVLASEWTNRSHWLDKMFRLDLCARRRLQQNRPQTMVSNTSKWPHCPESHALCSHRLRNIARPLCMFTCSINFKKINTRIKKNMLLCVNKRETI